jgi:hypothetical protein
MGLKRKVSLLKKRVLTKKLEVLRKDYLLDWRRMMALEIVIGEKGLSLGLGWIESEREASSAGAWASEWDL